MYVIQGDYGVGWEDLTASTDWYEAQQDLRAYESNEPQYPHRVKEID